VTNIDVATVNLVSVSANWDASLTGHVWQTLDFGGNTVWSGPGINSPGGTVGTTGVVDLPPGSKGLLFHFNKPIDLTPGLTYSVSATFDNGCSVTASFTN
jgi:hypothetical protein